MGHLISLYDKICDYETIMCASNVFKMYKDMPLFFDAWDIDEFYENQEVKLDDKCEIFFEYVGDMETVLVIKRKINQSSVIQRAIIRKDENKIDFETEIEWNEVHKLLKVDFNTAFSSDELVSEIQFGHIKRPTHRNRQFDIDRFEVCQHKWSFLGSDNCGLALLNDSKYGISVKQNSISLTLLKSATHPDLYADKGKQKFVYSVMACNNGLYKSRVCNKTYELNCPVIVKEGYCPETSFIKLDNLNIILDTVKVSEDGNGDIILRLYESKNVHTKVNVKLALKAYKVYLTDMLENNVSSVDMSDSAFELEFKPFEVKTVRIKK